VVIRPNQWSFTATLKPGGETFCTLSGATDVKIQRLLHKTQDEVVFEGKIFPSGFFPSRAVLEPADCKLSVKLFKGEPAFSLKTDLPRQYGAGEKFCTVPPLFADRPGARLVVPLNEGRDFDCAVSKE